MLIGAQGPGRGAGELNVKELRAAACTQWLVRATQQDFWSFASQLSNIIILKNEIIESYTSIDYL